MASRKTHQLPRRPAAIARERSDSDPDEHYGGRKLRPPPLNKKLPHKRLPSQSPPATEQGDVENHNDEVSSRSRSPSPAPARYRPIVTVDWRSELCRFLHLSNQTSDHEIFDALEETEEKLRDAERLKYQYTADPGPPRSQIMYTINCRDDERSRIYLDEPWPVESGPYHAHLRGSRPITNLELYLERNKNISFLVFRDYECCYRKTKWQFTNEAEQSTAVDLQHFFSREYIDLVSLESQTALTVLSETALEGLPHPPFDSENIGSIAYPYLWWFHRRNKIAAAKETMDLALQQHIDIVQAYMEDRLQPEWDTVDEFTEKGKITVDLLRYLFVKGENICQLNGLTAIGWLLVDNDTTDDARSFRASIQVEFWEFDGSFHNKTTRQALEYVPVELRTTEFDIVNLPIYPARFAEKSIVEGLRRRGEMFWACRHQKYVSYVKDTHDIVRSAVFVAMAIPLRY
ncbi:uncharacterized protein ColSpa_10266 [Colletotrichum spaethianum]|uniref:DUF7025 domain-containing protein n=1 Tax=Colletotrichum spaethianum TaxID=700344 RepID=A0AA37UP67_9PEZI|nr:uncharacterized protein ColSpa_10266 [Colletotrichum spaethianum]GKT50085.1 hypothetical protein ColSpa_10266 [Colletotrichum spaethianum]